MQFIYIFLNSKANFLTLDVQLGKTLVLYACLHQRKHQKALDETPIVLEQTRENFWCSCQICL